MEKVHVPKITCDHELAQAIVEKMKESVTDKNVKHLYYLARALYAMLKIKDVDADELSVKIEETLEADMVNASLVFEFAGLVLRLAGEAGSK